MNPLLDWRKFTQYNSLLILLKLSTQQIIIKQTQQLKGQIIIKPKYQLRNIPIHIQISGISCCDMYQYNHNQIEEKYTKSIMEISQLNSQRQNKKKNNNKNKNNKNNKKDNNKNNIIKTSDINLQITQAGFIQQQLNNHQEQNERFFKSFSYLTNQLSQNQPYSSSLKSTRYLTKSTLQSQQQFLQGKQTLYQINQLNQKRLLILEQNKNYVYPFVFVLPKQLPGTREEDEVLENVKLKVGYQVKVMIKVGEEDLIRDNNQQQRYQIKQYKQQQRQQQQIKQQIKQQQIKNINQSIKLTQPFYIIHKRDQQPPYSILTNKISFKYHNIYGKIHSNSDKKYIKFNSKYSSPSTTCLQKFIQCLSYIFNISNLSNNNILSYDLYHCQMMVNVNENNLLHLIVRLYEEPVKNKLDQRKIKKGKVYQSTKQIKQRKQHKQHNILIDKSNSPQKSNIKLQIQQNNNIKTQQQYSEKYQNKQNIPKPTKLLITLYGQLINIKKSIIFEKTLTLTQKNYDMLQGQTLVQIDKKYYTEHNQLFILKYYFQIQPIIDQEQKTNNNSKNQQKIQKYEDNVFIIKDKCSIYDLVL